MEIYHLPDGRTIECPSCSSQQQVFTWRGDGHMCCVGCAMPDPKSDWAAYVAQISDGFRTCDSCGGQRRCFTDEGICLKCDSERIAAELIASGPWGIIHD